MKSNDNGNNGIIEFQLFTPVNFTMRHAGLRDLPLLKNMINVRNEIFKKCFASHHGNSLQIETFH